MCVYVCLITQDFFKSKINYIKIRKAIENLIKSKIVFGGITKL